MTTLLMCSPRAQGALRAIPFWEMNLPDGAEWLRLFRTATGFLFRFPQQADFEVSVDLSAVACHPVPEIQGEVCRHLFSNQVLPMLLSHTGNLVLHASCIEIQGRAVAFVGPSGAGKSTLGAYAAKQGARLVCDDGLLVERIEGVYRALPAEPRMRLWADSAAELGWDSRGGNSKRVIDSVAGAFCPDAVPLRRVYVLDVGGHDFVATNPLGLSAGLLAMISNTFVLDPEDRTAMAAHFSRLVEFAGTGICRTLAYPREYSLLPTVFERVVRDLERDE